jgi:hypothetical protein
LMYVGLQFSAVNNLNVTPARQWTRIGHPRLMSYRYHVSLIIELVLSADVSQILLFQRRYAGNE